MNSASCEKEGENMKKIILAFRITSQEGIGFELAGVTDLTLLYMK